MDYYWCSPAFLSMLNETSPSIPYWLVPLMSSQLYLRERYGTTSEKNPFRLPNLQNVWVIVWFVCLSQPPKQKIPVHSSLICPLQVSCTSTMPSRLYGTWKVPFRSPDLTERNHHGCARPRFAASSRQNRPPPPTVNSTHKPVLEGRADQPGTRASIGV